MKIIKHRAATLPKSELIRLDYKLKFDGRDADQHRLEAYPAAHTLEGLTWALELALHFGITGNIRQRGNLSSSARIYISPPRRGSVINFLDIFVQENPFLIAVVGGYAVNTVTPYINGLISYAFNQALGARATIPNAAKKFLRKLSDDDLERLVTRIEPPLRRAHTAIGKTADTLTLQTKRTELAVLNGQTKAYLDAKLNEQFETIDTNVTSFNLLTRNGRLYDPDTESTEAFSVTTNPRDGTTSAIITSMEQFAQGRRGAIRIVAQRVETIENRLKKYVIASAEEIPHQDWVDGVDPLRSARSR